MELFEVSKDFFNGIPEFDDCFSNHDESPIENDLHIVAGLSQYSEEGFLHLLLARGFENENYAEITRIEAITRRTASSTQLDWTRSKQDSMAAASESV